MPVADEVLIAGGGISALRTAQALRGFGFEGGVTLFSEEEHLPYDRPALSKDHLTDGAEAPPAPLAGLEELDRLDIAVELGRRVVTLDTEARWFALEDGETVPYDAAVIATGAVPRMPSALADVGRVHVLRTADDAARLSTAMERGSRMVIVGGGFIGLEVASVARGKGCEVQVVEQLPTPFAQILGPDLGELLRKWHESHGVVFNCDATVAECRDRGRSCLLRLSDGTELDADSIVVGVGVSPAAEWLKGTPRLAIDHGILCDADGLTSVPWVYAVGDVAQRMETGRPLPRGHWTAATEQAKRTAAAMLGRFADRPPIGSLYFWSEQFGSLLQFAGTFPEGGQVEIEAGSVDGWRLLAASRTDGTLNGVFAVDEPRGFVRARAELNGQA